MTTNRKDSCFETCLAYILGVGELEVPFFTKEDPTKWLTNAREWLAKRGLYSIYTTYERDGVLSLAGAPFIAVGVSPNSEDLVNPHTHAVVMCLDEVVFDCADGIVGEPEYAIYIFSPLKRVGKLMADDEPEKLTHVVIDGETYEAPAPVLQLLLDVSLERDKLNEQLRFIYAPAPVSRLVC